MRLLPLVFLAACVSTTTRLYEVTVTGDIDAPDASAPVELSFQHAFAGEPPTDHPLGEVDAVWNAAPGEFAHTFAYPVDAGEGLVVYAWQDLDGDGVLCAPDSEDEWVGLTEVEAFPAHELDLGVLALDVACRGPEALFPPEE